MWTLCGACTGPRARRLPFESLAQRGRFVWADELTENMATMPVSPLIIDTMVKCITDAIDLIDEWGVDIRHVQLMTDERKIVYASGIKAFIDIDPCVRRDVWFGEQRSEKWQQVRNGRLTASQFGNANRLVSHMCDTQVSSMLWKPVMKSFAMEWGKVKESEAMRSYVDFMAHATRPTGHVIRVCERGIWISPTHPWLGVSPDGIAEVSHATMNGLSIDRASVEGKCIEGAAMDTNGERYLLEFKCPWKLRNRKNNEPMYPPVRLPNNRSGPIPMRYYDFAIHMANLKKGVLNGVRGLG